MALRAIPNLNVFRPADAQETVACFKMSIEQKGSPNALLLTRQGVKVLNQSMEKTVDGVSKGAYNITNCDNPDLILLATGSEVGLALEVVQLMQDKKIRVVSMPCWEIFEQQSEDYEAGITMGWDKYIGSNGLSIGLDHYGASAPGKDLAEEFGFTATKVEAKIRKHLNKLL